MSNINIFEKMLLDIEIFNSNNNYHYNNITNNNVQNEIKNKVTVEEFLNNITKNLPQNISNTTVEPTNNIVKGDFLLKFIQDIDRNK
jgi:hypothetical protein